jgi:hypothetical protein
LPIVEGARVSLIGSAIIASWSRVDAADRSAVRAWHNEEHIPERLALPGFLRARRYAGIGDEEAMFILYEVRDRDVLTGDSYLQRLNHPTPWTRESVVKLKQSARGICEILLSAGPGGGAITGTLRLGGAGGKHAAVRTLVDSALADRVLRHESVTGYNVARADRPASTIPTVERGERPVSTPDLIVIVEGSDAEELARALDLVASSFAQAPVRGLYRLEHRADANIGPI